AASICAGFPYTIAICFCCTALYRACKIEYEDEDILSGKKFHHRIFDFCEGFNRNDRPKGMPEAVDTMIKIAVATVIPVAPLLNISKHLYGSQGLKWVFMYAGLFYCWIGCLVASPWVTNIDKLGWVCFVGFTFGLLTMRIKTREIFNIYGSAIEDMLCCIMVYPLVLIQIEGQFSITAVELDDQVPNFLRKQKHKTDIELPEVLSKDIVEDTVEERTQSLVWPARGF
ncbi:hypothetical protein CYMTET_36376, partial [Cymbomonas tetramitiformis]